MRTLPPGWSQLPHCHLSAYQKYWFDPEGVAQATETETKLPDVDDTLDAIAEYLARWLNDLLRASLEDLRKKIRIDFQKNPSLLSQALPVGGTEFLMRG